MESLSGISNSHKNRSVQTNETNLLDTITFSGLIMTHLRVKGSLIAHKKCYAFLLLKKNFF